MVEKINDNSIIAERSASTIEEVTSNSSEVVSIMEVLKDQTAELQGLVNNLNEEMDTFKI